LDERAASEIVAARRSVAVGRPINEQAGVVVAEIVVTVLQAGFRRLRAAARAPADPQLDERHFGLQLDVNLPQVEIGLQTRVVHSVAVVNVAVMMRRLDACRSLGRPFGRRGRERAFSEDVLKSLIAIEALERQDQLGERAGRASPGAARFVRRAVETRVGHRHRPVGRGPRGIVRERLDVRRRRKTIEIRARFEQGALRPYVNAANRLAIPGREFVHDLAVLGESAMPRVDLDEFLDRLHAKFAVGGFRGFVRFLPLRPIGAGERTQRLVHVRLIDALRPCRVREASDEERRQDKDRQGTCAFPKFRHRGSFLPRTVSELRRGSGARRYWSLDLVAPTFADAKIMKDFNTICSCREIRGAGYPASTIVSMRIGVRKRALERTSARGAMQSATPERLYAFFTPTGATFIISLRRPALSFAVVY
jgi:hypothetical protein